MLRSLWRLSSRRPAHMMLAASQQQQRLSTHPQPERELSIQGLQGELKDDPRFDMWLQNCQRWGLGDCHQKAKEVAEGRKTLDQLFKEQEEMLKILAGEEGTNVNAVERQEDIFLTSPQGIQGDDCERYRLWLRNCQQFGFGNCNQQLIDVREGRKTLSQVFAEQDSIIREAAIQWRASSPQNIECTIPRNENVNTESSKTVEEEDSSSQDGALSTKDKMKRAVKDYGSTVIVFHVGISLMSLGGFYGLVSSGVDVVALLKWLNVGESIVQSSVAAGASTFVLAYAAHKVFAPVRMAITLTCVPFIVWYLRRIKFLKKP